MNLLVGQSNYTTSLTTTRFPSGRGEEQFTASETSTYRMIGLSNGDIDFGFYVAVNGQDHMVSPKIMAEINELYEALAEQTLDIHEYSGRLAEVVFDIFTADSFVAGIASKLLEQDTITAEERAFVRRPMLLDDHWWQCDDGQLFDIRSYANVKVLASAVERLRRKCDEALTSTIE